jgi:hypothetical protein
VMGHSLGTYMSMEIIRRLREEARDDPDGDDSIRVVGGVLLFATVMELAKSPSGVRLGVCTFTRHRLRMGNERLTTPCSGFLVSHPSPGWCHCSQRDYFGCLYRCWQT